MSDLGFRVYGFMSASILGFYRVYKGIMEKKMETTIVYWASIRAIL